MTTDSACARARVLELPLMPAHRHDGKSGLLQPPFMRFPSGLILANRPEGVPPDAVAVVVRRRGRTWLFAEWTLGRETRRVSLCPADDPSSPNESARAEDSTSP